VKTLPKNLSARISAAGRGSESFALAGTVRAVQTMGMRKERSKQGERSPEQEYLSVNWPSEQEEEGRLI
jgi:hypothetical protein